jgi:hypothetical protein
MRTNHITDHIMICAMLLCSLTFLIVSCKKNNVADPPAGITTPFTGITETDPTGPEPIGKVDPDDWKPLMDCPSSPKILHISSTESVKNDSVADKPTCTKIHPVYPNPASKNFIISYSLNEQDSVVITLNSTPTNVVKELLKRRLAAGSYSIAVNGSDLQPAIYRVYITVFRQSDVLGSYGDVQIVN